MEKELKVYALDMTGKRILEFSAKRTGSFWHFRFVDGHVASMRLSNVDVFEEGETLDAGSLLKLRKKGRIDRLTLNPVVMPPSKESVSAQDGTIEKIIEPKQMPAEQKVGKK